MCLARAVSLYGALVGLEYEGYLGDLLVFDYKKQKNAKCYVNHIQTKFGANMSKHNLHGKTTDDVITSKHMRTVRNSKVVA